ncbi:hypothetical protein CB0940_11874 [Cercospora beticola]|uniref:Uncharacterized protein n=1 Tax=Cercospora beticola TaxID=122368 RepID=A0A2G5IDY3_CERBT|nr:hypothetical protein CB0940_11874 [Cercospora beticola]PIB03011.1 hypothetical protein CB0940_11874 [Cercospora beticola]WPB04234.1 hypothetical protein RHO25_008879 [Cercospora beticola]
MVNVGLRDLGLQERSNVAQQYRDATRSDRHAWRGGVLRRMPWVGLLALSLALLCIAGAVAILFFSDGRPIGSWKYSPSVYVSFAYTIANVLLQDAMSRGATINWWKRAIADGTNIGDLHRNWDYGSSALASLKAGRHFNFIAFVTLFLTITPLNGPLLQRSSEVEISKAVSNVDVSIQAAQRIDLPTGYMSGRLRVVPLLHEDFAPVFRAFESGRSIPANKTGCSGDGKCSGRLKAAGLSVNCSSYTVPFSVVPGDNCNSIDPEISQECINAQAGTFVYRSALSWVYDQPGRMNLDIQYKDNSDCEGVLMVQNRALQAATVEYPVIIDGNSSTISLDPKTTLYDDKVLHTNEYEDPGTQGPTELGGFAHALEETMSGYTHIRFAGTIGYEILSTGPVGTRFANMSEAVKKPAPLNQDLCSIYFNDPVPAFLEQARQLMFRTALTMTNTSDMQKVQLNQIRTMGVYRAQYAYLGAAVGLSLAAVIVILTMYNGFWLLGRKVSMSPIEIAKAFNADILKNEHPNAEVDELVKEVGSRAVMYGVTQASTSGYAPGGYEQNKDSGYIQVRSVNQGQELRLEMADPSKVQALVAS